MRFNIQTNLIAVLVVVGIGVLWGGIQCFIFLNKPLIAANNPPVEFILQPGTPVKVLAAELQAKRVLAHPRAFVWLARIKLQTKQLQAGEYRIDPGMTSFQLLKKLATGQVILYTFTIVPGWTFQQLLEVLEHDPHLQHNLQNLTAAEIMQRLGHPEDKPEGKFFPDTYKFHADFDDTKILQEAYQLMQQRLQQMWLQRDPEIPYNNSYNVLIVASMIEKETAVAKERPIISGIVVRRLQKNMYLQLDPTVIYGLGKTGKLTVSDLKKNTPYNTYMHKGLPPTPICMPSADSVYAALHPAAGKVLYFVAKGDGSHVFSVTLKEHDAAIKKYQIDKK